MNIIPPNNDPAWMARKLLQQQRAQTHHPADLIEVGYPEFLLRCPSCGDTYTHINRVSMLDAAGHALTLVGFGDDESCTMNVETTVPDGATNNGRRQSVAMEITCEMCLATSVIVFRQVKGSTVIDFNIRESE